MKARPRSLFLYGLSAILIGYHASNAISRKWWKPTEGKSQSDLVIKMGDRQMKGSFTAHRPPSCRIDGASTGILRGGYIVRYELGDLPTLLVEGKSSTPRKFFHRQEIALQFPEAIAKAQEALAQIRTLIRHLEENGVRTLVVPVPTKIAIERKDLSPANLPLDDVFRPRERAPKAEDSAAVYRAVLRNTLGRGVDLLKPFQKSYEAELFIPDDEHWTQFGMAVAAQSILAKLEHEGRRYSRPLAVPPRFAGYAEPNAHFTLTDTFALPDFFMMRSRELLWREPLYALPKRELKGGGSGSRTVVVGSSFCNRWHDSPFSLAHLLSQRLRSSAVSFCKDGGGISGGFTKMKEAGFSLQPGDLVVWEFPLHSLLTPTVIALPKIEPAQSERL